MVGLLARLQHINTTVIVLPTTLDVGSCGLKVCQTIYQALITAIVIFLNSENSCLLTIFGRT